MPTSFGDDLWYINIATAQLVRQFAYSGTVHPAHGDIPYPRRSCYLAGFKHLFQHLIQVRSIPEIPKHDKHVSQSSHIFKVRPSIIPDLDVEASLSPSAPQRHRPLFLSHSSVRLPGHHSFGRPDGSVGGTGEFIHQNPRILMDFMGSNQHNLGIC